MNMSNDRHSFTTQLYYSNITILCFFISLVFKGWQKLSFFKQGEVTLQFASVYDFFLAIRYNIFYG